MAAPGGAAHAAAGAAHAPPDAAEDAPAGAADALAGAGDALVDADATFRAEFQLHDEDYAVPPPVTIQWTPAKSKADIGACGFRWHDGESPVAENAWFRFRVLNFSPVRKHRLQYDDPRCPEDGVEFYADDHDLENEEILWVRAPAPAPATAANGSAVETDHSLYMAAVADMYDTDESSDEEAGDGEPRAYGRVSAITDGTSHFNKRAFWCVLWQFGGEIAFGSLQEMLAGKGAMLLVDTLEACLEEEIRPRQALQGVPEAYRMHMLDITGLPMDNEATNQLFLQLLNERRYREFRWMKKRGLRPSLKKFRRAVRVRPTSTCCIRCTVQYIHSLSFLSVILTYHPATI